MAARSFNAQTPRPGDKTITESDCTTSRVGDSIPVTAIGEAVSSVSLSAPRWTAATGAVPAYCSIDGVLAPVDSSPTARPINFRVVLPASWNRRAAQFGGAGMNGTIPNLTGSVVADRSQTPLQRGFVVFGSDSGHQAGRGAGAGSTGARPDEWALND